MISKALLVFGGIGAGLAIMVASSNSSAAANPSPGAALAGGGFGPMRRGTTYHLKTQQKPEPDGAIDLGKTVTFLRGDGWEGITSAFDPVGNVLQVATWNGPDGAILPALSKSQLLVYTVVAAVP